MTLDGHIGDPVSNFLTPLNIIGTDEAMEFKFRRQIVSFLASASLRMISYLRKGHCLDPRSRDPRNFQPVSLCIPETMRHRAIVTMER